VTDNASALLSIPIIALTVRENTPIQNGDSAVTYGKQPTKQLDRKMRKGIGSRPITGHVPSVRVGVAGGELLRDSTGLRQGERIVGDVPAIRELKDGTNVGSGNTLQRNDSTH